MDNDNFSNETKEESPINCYVCKYVKHGITEDEGLWAKCGATGEELNPYDLCYSIGIGNKCPYHQ